MIDFSKYVRQFREPKSYSLGPALRELTQQRQNQERIDNQASQYSSTRSDTQAWNAAEFASKRGDASHKQSMDRYTEQRKLVDAATKAAQAGDWNTARALLPRVLELGGEASETGAPGAPVFRFKSGEAPTQGPLDVAGARQQIYGGAPGPQRNPFTPPALPGASAAALPPKPAQNPAIGAPPAPPAAAPPDTGPPPGAAVDPPPGPARSVPPEGAVWLPPGVDPGPQPASAEADLAALNAAGGEPDLESAPTPAPPPEAQQPDATGPNPFDPYTIDTSRVAESNRLRLDPTLRGIEAATPSRFRTQIEQYNRGLGSLGLSPAATLELMRPYYSELTSSHRGQVTAEAQAVRAEQMQEQRESARQDKDRSQGFTLAKNLTNLDKLSDTKKKINVSRGVDRLLKSAHRNGASANAVIRQVYNMYAAGVMTDKDYDDTKEGIRTMLESIKNKTFEKLYNPNKAGLAPKIAQELTELVSIALEGHKQDAKSAHDTLYRAYKASTVPGEKQAIKEYMMAALPEEYWPPEFVPGTEQNVPEVAAEDEQATMERMAAAEGGVVDNIGVAPVPEGRHPNAPANPPGKKKMTREELRRAMAEELRKAKGAPESNAP